MAKRRTEADRNHDRYEMLRQRLTDIFKQAIRCHYTHDRILEERSALFAMPEYKKLTQGCAFGLHEISRVWFDRISQEHLVWRTGPESGPTRTSHRDPWTEAESELCRTKTMFGGHFWDNTDVCYNGWKNLG